MKHCLKLIFALFVATTIAISPIHADDEESLVVSIETDSFKLAETDISSLATGESKTIETESGQVIVTKGTIDSHD